MLSKLDTKLAMHNQGANVLQRIESTHVPFKISKDLVARETFRMYSRCGCTALVKFFEQSTKPH